MPAPLELAQNAKKASRQLALALSAQKNLVLTNMAELLLKNQQEILTANAADVSDAQAAGLSASMVDRLMLNSDRLQKMADDLRKLAQLSDPVGEVYDEKTITQSGLRLCKQRVPLGVLAVIYESRPNVTLDSAGLAIKSGNAVILRGGKETIRSNRVLVKIARQALKSADLNEDSIQFIDDPDRALVLELLKLYQWIDMVIPRGGGNLQNFCRENSLIPVITGGVGICHLYVDASANLEAALPVIRNAKIQRPTVCNALDTLLVDRNVAVSFIPRLVDVLTADGVSFKADAEACKICCTGTECLPKSVQPAGEGDFDTEWLSLVLGIQVVDGLEAAMDHIAVHGTGHSDGILTENQSNADRFIREVDSAAVYVNASTRFTDGGQFGLGAEVAISTQRLHARGPMGLHELTTYKWVARGNYSVRQ